MMIPREPSLQTFPEGSPGAAAGRGSEVTAGNWHYCEQRHIRGNFTFAATLTLGARAVRLEALRRAWRVHRGRFR